MRPEDDPGWAMFPETRLELELGGERVELDLRRPIDAVAAATCAAAGLRAPWVVVTACNPGGGGFAEPDAAAAADQRLRERLRGVAAEARSDSSPGVVAVWRATGRSIDGRHVEPGWAAPVPVAVGQRIAGAFGQTAIFAFLDAGLRSDGGQGGGQGGQRGQRGQRGQDGLSGGACGLEAWIQPVAGGVHAVRLPHSGRSGD
ncbi:MAG: DUF3293 domain-containing protein [Phycisphaerales bacterium]